MNYLSVENLSKSYGDKLLFESISFGIDKGQKAALVAKNGSGKSTLLKIIIGREAADQGDLSFRNDIQVGYLEQDPIFKEGHTIMDAVLDSANPMITTIRLYEKALKNSHDTQAMQEAVQQMDNLKAWDYEAKIKEILSRLRVDAFDQPVASLSGGQRKRVALAKLLIDQPDFFILDEPTNHLDLDMIEWLEEYLGNQQVSLLMVTHDRYFLERVCDTIFELDQGQLFRYPGNYSYYLEKKEERQSLLGQEVDKARNLMRKELDWIRRQPKARGTKSKARIDAFEDLQKTAGKNVQQKNLELDVQTTRLGKKILELHGISKSYPGKVILQDFDYIFKRKERLGIVGSNGVGKSTFLNLITGAIPPDEGEIITGETVVFGYYTQAGLHLPEDKRVIEVVLDIAEYIPLSNGQSLSAAQLLERFLFDRKAQYAYVSTLSGGERRRLYLLTILAKNPNFLILDEPTNDLDLLTLQILEEFLVEFGGCLVLVTHDRHFMDKLVDHLFIFEGNAKIRDFNGTYSHYRVLKELEESEAPESRKKETKTPTSAPASSSPEKKKLSYKEKKEYESLERDIEKLEDKKTALEEALSSGNLSPEELQSKSEEIAQLIDLIDEKSDRWLELGEYL